MKALVLVDIQNDFLPGGPMAVKNGGQVVEPANRLMKTFELVVASQDWHPADHVSFAANHEGRQAGEVITVDGLRQILWPVHCVADTRGAQLADGLDRDGIDKIIRKGTDSRLDSYSAFFDNGRRAATGLGDFLARRGADEVYVCGLTTDYCVKFTALDARSLGLETYVIADACRAVELQPGDADRALDEMTRAGAHVVTSEDILAP